MSRSLRTPLHDIHKRLGARMVEFAGFEMPVQYSSILAEHEAVRERAGLFDVSHMGQIHLSGPAAEGALERLFTRAVASQRPGRVRYGLLCNQTGGVVDDATLYRLGEDAFFLCVNASNIEKDYRWVVQHSPAEAEVRNRSAETGLLALQGPASAAMLAEICDPGVGALRRYAFGHFELVGHRTLISRTGYTGSDGFEIYLEARHTRPVFEALLDAGGPLGLLPAGLGARDTLRLEAGMPLYGHELDDTTSPLEAGLDRFVDLRRGGFIGAEAIEKRRAAGHERALVGFEVLGRGIAREGYELRHEDRPVGVVTSGAPSPTLGRPIGLGYASPALAAPGTRLEVMIRGRAVSASVVKTPFVESGRSAPPGARA